MPPSRSPHSPPHPPTDSKHSAANPEPQTLNRRYDLATGQQTLAGKHDGAVRCVEYDADHGLIVTGSWDCSVRCWDPRSKTMAALLRQPHKVHRPCPESEGV
jgi:WD40 repeat protein